jgi:transcriptional regulator with XRE-family HTH domain
LVGWRCCHGQQDRSPAGQQPIDVDLRKRGHDGKDDVSVDVGRTAFHLGHIPSRYIQRSRELMLCQVGSIRMFVVVPPTFDLKKVRERLKELRTSHNLSQRELAKTINVSPSYISAVERGADKINADILAGLAIHFAHLNLDWLLLGRGNQLLGEVGDPDDRLDLGAVRTARDIFYRRLRESDAAAAAALIAHEADHFCWIYERYMSELRIVRWMEIGEEQARSRALAKCEELRFFPKTA